MALASNNTNVLNNTAMTVGNYPFSLSGWFRVPNVNSLISLMGLINFSTGQRCDLFFAGDTTKAALAKTEGAASGAAYSTSAMAPGQWHHLLGVFSADNERKIYLDGGNVGTDTTAIGISTLNILYAGNLGGSDFVDIADVALIGAVVDAEQATVLAQGMPVLASSLADDVLAYQDCIREKNRPGLGVEMASAGVFTVVDHPPTRLARSVFSSLQPARVRGPFRMDQAVFHALSAANGQVSVAGVISQDTVLPGEVVS